jgi:hypothetical protein
MPARSAGTAASAPMPIKILRATSFLMRITGFSIR